MELSGKLFFNSLNTTGLKWFYFTAAAKTNSASTIYIGSFRTGSIDISGYIPKRMNERRLQTDHVRVNARDLGLSRGLYI